MSTTTRKLLASETPTVGDVCQMFVGAHGTAIVVRVYEDKSVDLERVYMQVHGRTPSIGVKRILKVGSTHLEFYTYRDGISNSAY